MRTKTPAIPARIRCKNCTRVTLASIAEAALRECCALLLDFDRSADLDGRAEALIVGIFHGHADVHTADTEIQRIVRMRVGWEPVRAGYVFAVRSEVRKDIFVVLL